MSDGKKRHAGQFKPGQSGNPGGSPRGLVASIRAELGPDTIKILRIYRDLAIGLSPAGYDDAKASDRMRAGEIVVDRVLGKATQVLDVTTGQTTRIVDRESMSDEAIAALASIQFIETEPGEGDVH